MTDRRKFLKGVGALGAAGAMGMSLSAKSYASILGANDRVNVGFMGVAPQAQQAHIIDAYGTLADITTKFNTLLADIEGYGLLASS